MKKFTDNKDGFALMSWEQNPLKRNINNTVKFNVNQHVDVNVGDQIIGQRTDSSISVYTITEVVECRPSNMIGKSYVTTKTTHEFIPIQS